MLRNILNRLLLNAEADAGAGGDPGAGGAPGGGGAPSPAAGGGNGGGAPSPAWYAPAETLKASDPQVWESFEKGVKSGGHKDLATLIKNHHNLEAKLGTAIALPGKEAKPEDIEKWSKELGEKVKSHGLAVVKAQSAPPESADKYELDLEAIPEPLRSDTLVSSFREIAHKHGLSQEAVNDIMALETQRYNETVKPVIEISDAEAAKEFKNWAASIGKDVNELQSYGGAWLAKNCTDKQIQALERAGLDKHPAVLQLVAKAGLDTGEDISVIHGAGGTLLDTEYDELLKNLSDPNHEDHKLWMHGNPQDPKRIALMQKKELLEKKKFGTGPAPAQ